MLQNLLEEQKRQEQELQAKALADAIAKQRAERQVSADDTPATPATSEDSAAERAKKKDKNKALAGAIKAGAEVVGGVLDQAAELKREQANAIGQGAQTQFQGGIDGQRLMTAGQQDAIKNILGNFKASYF